MYKILVMLGVLFSLIVPSGAYSNASESARQPSIVVSDTAPLPPCTRVPIDLVLKKGLRSPAKRWLRAAGIRNPLITPGAQLKVSNKKGIVKVNGIKLRSDDPRGALRFQRKVRRSVLSQYANGCGSPGCYVPTEVQNARSLPFSYAGRDNTYNLYKPTVAPTPLVVLLHGAGHSANFIEGMSGFREYATRMNWAILSPQETAKQAGLWDMTEDAKMIQALITKIEAENCVDQSRVFVSGFSQGAMLASLLACDTRIFAGAAPVAGIIQSSRRICDSGTSLRAFHGAQDQILRVNGTFDPALESLIPKWTLGVSRWFTADRWAQDNGCTEVRRRITTRAHEWSWSCDERGHSIQYFENPKGTHDWPTYASEEIAEMVGSTRRTDLAPLR